VVFKHPFPRVLALIGALLLHPVAAATQNAQENWHSMNQELVKAYRGGRYAEGVKIAEQAYRLALEAFGQAHINTFTSMNNLGGLYQILGRYVEAEPLFEDALALQQKHLGPRHISTLNGMNSLAILYQRQGRYSEAEPLYKEALKLLRVVLNANHRTTLACMNNLASLYQRQGRYSEAEPLFKEALALRSDALGPRHPDTLSSMNNLAGLYVSQSRYSKAEILQKKTLSLRRDVLGPRHPSTLTSTNNLAMVYENQGRYSEAEPLYKDTLAFRRVVLGQRHPETLGSINNLASLYKSQGQYSKAEPLYRKALSLRRANLGLRHPDTLSSMNNLAALYRSQFRYSEAEPIYREALALRRVVLGPHHPDTLNSMNSLAGLHASRSQYSEAERLYAEALAVRRRVLGAKHASTISSMNNLAGLYGRLGRYPEAEALYMEALAILRVVFGPQHPNTISSLNNLAYLYNVQGRYTEADPLYKEALALVRVALGHGHPDTISVSLNVAGNFAALNMPREATAVLRQIQPGLLDWLATELYATTDVTRKGAIVASQSSFQDFVFGLAVDFPSEHAIQQMAALSALRFKGMLAEEEAFIARLSRRSDSPSIQEAAKNLAAKRRQLSVAFHNENNPKKLDALLREANAAEVALGRVSRTYADQLQVRKANLEDLQAVLPDDSVLIAFRRYRRAEFGKGLAEERLAAVVVEGFERTTVVDLGKTGDLSAHVAAVMMETDSADQYALALYRRLIKPLALSDHILRLTIAPDGVLHLLPFHRLLDEGGRHLTTLFDLRVVQTARDLLRPVHDKPARGLLALGGIDFGAVPASTGEIKAGAFDASRDRMDLLRNVTADSFRSGFAPLANTGPEVTRIQQLYRQARPQEPTDIWLASEASEARLKRLARPPRVLHLATHGFYRKSRHRRDRPMLLSGVTLAGANRALGKDGEDGILYAIEIQDLNLEGTELVVLSACETAQGVIDHGEGVYGMVRALRTAGARHVLVTLRPIGDASAPRFMEQFYLNWLNQERSDPGAAFQAAQAYFIRNNPRFEWSPYVMIGG